jgi:hypothetical protein
MTDANPAIVKLQHIRQLWAELARSKPNTPECRDIMNKIRALSAEYQSLVDASPTSGKSK